METALQHLLTNYYKADMIAYMDAHPEDFNEAILLAVSDNQPYAWRAAWLLWSCMHENDNRIQAYIPDIVKALATKEDDHQRELIKILLQMDLGETYEGYLFDLCVTIWDKIHKRPSVRVTALKLILKIAKKHRDLAHEISFLTADPYLESLSPAARKSVAKMLKEIT